MSRNEAVETIVKARGLEDRYTLLISKYAEDKRVTDREIRQLMYDILFGVFEETEE